MSAGCVSHFCLEGSNAGLNIGAVKQSLSLKKQQTTGSWRLFFHACYAAGEKWSISTSPPTVFANKTYISSHKKHSNKKKTRITSLIQPLHLCVKFKIRLIPSWSQLTKPLHICQSRLCKLWSAGWRHEFYTLDSIFLKGIIDLGDASISLCPTELEKNSKKSEGGKRGHGCASFSYCNEAKEA